MMHKPRLSKRQHNSKLCRPKFQSSMKLANKHKTASTLSKQSTPIYQHACKRLQALQAKVQTNDKLKPWLASHGLDGLQALWQRIHIQAGWENALEAALRERLSGFEISKLEMVSGFAADAPPTKLTFFTPANAALESAPGDLQRLSDLLRLNDAGHKALMGEWLQGCFVAADLSASLVKASTT
jgi:chromosome segregation protein